MPPLDADRDGVYLASVSSVRPLEGGLWLVRLQTPDGVVRYIVVPDTLADQHGVRIAVGAAVTLGRSLGLVP